MEENLENKKYTENLEKLEYKKISNGKKRVKGTLIILGLIVVFLLLAGLTLQIFFKIKPDGGVDIIRLLTALILIPLYLESLAIYIIIWGKSKKYLRTVLIISILFFCIIRVVLTKGFVLPDYFEINCIGNEKIIKDECVDCKCEIIRIGPMIPLVPIGHNGKVCCEGTYEYKINHKLMKPVIYLYPTTETQVNIKLGTPENLSHTYPKYNPEKGRNVMAQPNGYLKDVNTGRKLYALYREGKSSNETNFDEGFVVEGKDIIPFLEEKLAILGLNEREAEEFIVYWLPQMEDNKYNLIRFETIEEQNENMPLKITPTPDTVIRVMMDWKTIDEPINIPQQHLTTPKRNGFTVVERGGSPRN